MNCLGSKVANDITQAINNLFQCGKDFIPKPHLAKFFPDLLNWIHLWCIWRNEKEFNIIWNAK